MEKQLVTDKELHQRYPQLSLWAIRELRRRGEIPYVKLPGIRCYYFDAEKIDRWLDSLQNCLFKEKCSGMGVKVR